MATNEVIKMFETILSVQNMSIDCINKAKDLFDEYKNRGIILGSDFSDTKWQFSDEYSHVGIVFIINKFSYRCYYEDCFNISDDLFIEYLKTYVLFTMGDLVLKSLQNVVNDVKRFIACNPNDLYGLKEEVALIEPNRVIEFFSMLPETTNSEKVERMMDVLDAMVELNYTNSSSRKRSLASFDSYFLFNDIINDYWTSVVELEERLFYYPLYLWWKITGVIPLRPREFLLTPRKCLKHKSDGWYLLLRRNHIKGSDKKISYKIDDDYFMVSYKIPDRLAREIQKYIDITKNMNQLNLIHYLLQTHIIMNGIIKSIQTADISLIST